MIYRSMSGDEYRAAVVNRRHDGTVDLDVIVPNCEQRVRLTKIVVGLKKGMARYEEAS